MARGVVALSIGALLTVSVVGLCLPDGALLCDRDLDALVGGSYGSWCWACPNCMGEQNCHEDVCTEAEVSCPNVKKYIMGGGPEYCDEHMGNLLCSIDPVGEEMHCASAWDCECVEDGPGLFRCELQLPTWQVYYTVDFTDPVVCYYSTASPGSRYTTCQ